MGERCKVVFFLLCYKFFQCHRSRSPPAPEGVTTHIVFEARLRPLGLWVSGAKWLLFLHTAVPQYYGMKGVSLLIVVFIWDFKGR